ncbi:hypothetical protein FOZ76_10455 [Verticiella sediminum]|uniref:Uncharacterized protein n=1 Tax=Verticiella sediminum TaxID=1247510 RepID=A0A556AS67_9BURK|nr:hypothetical protein FOZ76_10455 [Verticiella sediminum]
MRDIVRTLTPGLVFADLPFLGDAPPVLVDWLSWHHIFDANHNIGIVLYNGGTLYIDDGKPAQRRACA